MKGDLNNELNIEDLKLALQDVINMEQGNVTKNELYKTAYLFIEDYDYKVTDKEVKNLIENLKF